MKIKTMAKVAFKFIDDNLPTILSVMALIGLGGSVASAIHDTPKAVEAITEAKLDKAESIERKAQDEVALDIYRNEQGELSLEYIKLTPWEYFKVLAPIYWRTAACTIVTGACIITSNQVSKKRYAALLAALSLKSKELKEYEDKVKELFGEKKAEEVQKELRKDYAMNVPDDNDIYQTSNGTYLCYEPISRSYFRSSINAVKSGINDFNSQMIKDQSASVADLCACLDIMLPDPYYEDRLIWDYDISKKNTLRVSFDFNCNPRTNEPCLVLDYDRRPVYN